MEVISGSKKILLSVVRPYEMGVPPNRSSLKYEWKSTFNHWLPT